MLTRRNDLAYPSNTRPVVFLAAVLAAILAAMLLLTPAGAVAGDVPDWNDSVDTLAGAVGLHYGKIGGHGLSFRLPIKWWLYFQVAGGVWHTSDKKQHNVGFQLNYLLRQDQRVRIYLTAGTAYFYKDEQIRTDVWQTDDDWNVGAGVGLEYLVGRRWALQAEGDFAYHGDSSDITVIAQAGIHYYW